MAIRVVCPECQATYTVAKELRGKKGRCRACNASFLIEETAKETGRAASARRAQQSPGAEEARAVRRERRDDDDARTSRQRDRKPRRPSSAVVPLLVVGGLIITVLTAVGAGVGVWAYRKSQRSDDGAAGGPAAPPGGRVEQLQSFWAAALPPFENRGVSNTEDVDLEALPAEEPGNDPGGETAPAPVKKPTPTAASAFVGQLSPEVLQKVKRATFYLRVTMVNDQRGTGSGFLIDEAGTVVTNAHVLGMMQRGNAKPKQIEALIDSGEPTERKVRAEVLGVDRRNDLALLRVPSQGLPPPLTVKSAEDLLETQPLWVSGFPFGEGLGKNVTLSDCRVSSLRKENGVLARVQVHGDMQPGNSGGPVVDAQGDVVGVSVAIIRLTRINFAIPADMVLSLINGRSTDLTLGVPYREGGQVQLPVTVKLQDALERIRKVSVEYWPGDPGRERPPGRTAPAERKGDGTRTPLALTYDAKTGEAHGALALPELPEGKVCWLQPVFEDGRGVTQWARGVIWQAQTPVDRKPVVLATRPTGPERMMTLRQETNLRFGYTLNGVHEVGVTMETQWKESLHPGGGNTAWEARRQYANLSLAARYNRGKLQESTLPARLAEHLASLQGKVRLDRDFCTQGAEWGADLPKVSLQPRQHLTNLHAITQRTLDMLALPLPGRQVAPGATWKPAGPRTLHLETFEIGSAGATSIEWTFTYAGLRQRDGRAEAVVALSGVVREQADPFHDAAGSGSGVALLDPETGHVLGLDANIQVDFTTTLRSFPVPVRSATAIHLKEVPGGPAR